MTLIINLPPDLERRLEREAQSHGVDPSAYARHLLERSLSPVGAAERNRATLDLLAEWGREDQTNDLEELRRRDEEAEALKRSLNDNRTSGRKPFPPP